MKKLKLIILTSVVSIGIIGVMSGCGKDTKLVTESHAFDATEAESQEVQIEEVKDTDIVKDGNLINLAKDYSVSASEVSKILDNPYQGEGKQIFLTFDDGPSEGTDKVLKILEDKGVHGTFFVLGESLDKPGAEERLKTTIQKGNAIANHTYSHDYKKLYPNGKADIDTFMKELDDTNKRMKEILGEEFNASVIRMPSGHMSRKYYNDPNLGALDAKFKEEGIVQLDWTAENGDGMSRKESLDTMLNRVYEQTKEQKNIVLLMHDSKGKDLTIEALPIIIDHFKEKGFTFKVIANDNIEK